jgi:hypothetical protein
MAILSSQHACMHATLLANPLPHPRSDPQPPGQHCGHVLCAVSMLGPWQPCQTVSPCVSNACMHAWSLSPTHRNIANQTRLKPRQALLLRLTCSSCLPHYISPTRELKLRWTPQECINMFACGWVASCVRVWQWLCDLTTRQQEAVVAHSCHSQTASRSQVTCRDSPLGSMHALQWLASPR